MIVNLIILQQLSVHVILPNLRYGTLCVEKPYCLNLQHRSDDSADRVHIIIIIN